MAHTYDEFITAANGAGLLDKFTDDDLNIAKNNPEYGLSALKLQQDLLGAKTTEQKMLAQESLNQLRKSYGFGSGTAVQSSAAPTSAATAAATPQTPGGSFSYGNQNVYQKLLEEVTNPKPFEYNAAEDPTFGSMKKSYLREGDRARENTMANYAAMTGGVPSSAAITAAQQAGDYYSAQLNDAIPALEQNAYQRYLSEYDAKQAALGAITADRNFDWNAYLQKYDMEQAAKQQEFSNALALYNALGYATPEIAAVLGIQANVPEQKVYYNPVNNEPTVDQSGNAAVLSNYMAMKKSGASARELTEYLSLAIDAGAVTSSFANELRNMRY